MALVFNPSTGRVSPQHHVVFIDVLSTVNIKEEETAPFNWSDLMTHSSELATKQDFNMAETCLAEGDSPSDLTPTENPVRDPYAIVTDHHVLGNKRGKRGRSQLTLEQVATGATLSTSLEDSEGGLLSSTSKRGHAQCTSAVRRAPPGVRRERVEFDSANTTETTIGPSDDLKMPTRINLHEAGLRRSPRLMNGNKQKSKAHVTFGTKAKSKMLGLFTMISPVSSVILPQYQAGQNETTIDRPI